MTSAPTIDPFDESPDPTAKISRADLRVDVSAAVPLASGTPFELAISIVARSAGTGTSRLESPVVLVCCPGGFLSRRYFDLTNGESTGDRAARTQTARTFSFAEAMARRGAIVVSFDPFGVGESDRPESDDDAYAIDVETLAAIHQSALESVLSQLAEGLPEIDLPSIVSPTLFGVGHSMGSALTVEQQALAKAYAGLILFSFTTAGVPRFLSDSQRAVAHDPARARAEIGRLTLESFGSPYPARAADSEEGRVAAFGVGTAPPEAEEALHDAATSLLGAAGLLSMIPDGFAPSAARIEVPVLIALGDHDLHDERGLDAMLPNASSVSILALEDCWHCHFVANTRETLWREVAEWIRAETRAPRKGRDHSPDDPPGHPRPKPEGARP